MTDTQTQEAPGTDRATAETRVVGYAVRHLRDGFDFYQMDCLRAIGETVPGSDEVVNVYRNRDADVLRVTDAGRALLEKGGGQ